MPNQILDCPEVIGKTVKSLRLHSNANSLEEILIEFGDGTSFSASCESRVEAKASLIRTGTSAPEILKTYIE
jgi:hypothetical protein